MNGIRKDFSELTTSGTDSKNTISQIILNNNKRLYLQINFVNQNIDSQSYNYFPKLTNDGGGWLVIVKLKDRSELINIF